MVPCQRDEAMENKPSKLAITGLVVGVAAYDFLCPKGETISEGVDRLMENHKAATLTVIGVTALHLANILPERYDPFHRLTTLKRSREDDQL